ncbi:chitin binding Peritrophin-A domain protein [Trichuris suis]|nr:chitin binding Peritrophin-A domain protein [Trichuris suis]
MTDESRNSEDDEDDVSKEEAKRCDAMHFQVLLALSCAALILPVQGRNYVRGCYFTNWAQYRQAEGKYFPEDYEVGLCEYVFYAFAKLNSDFTVTNFEWNDIDRLYPALMKFKKSQPDLKVLLSIGGWNAGTSVFKHLAQSFANRKKFIDSVVSFIRQHNFDGLDLDWEYPDAADKANYVALNKELHERFIEEGKSNGSGKLYLTAAVSLDNAKVDAGYDAKELSKYWDFMNLMSYDVHGGWEMKTGVNSPLYPRSTDPEWAKYWNIAGSAIYWNWKGMPKEKIVIGLATYGRGWTLASMWNTGVDAVATGPSTTSPYLGEAGVIAYYEICQRLATGGKRHWDHETKTPYLIYGNQWFTYDDEESIKYKLLWLMKEGYGGAFVWTLDYDDFKGTACKHNRGKKYPLVSLMKEMLSARDGDHLQGKNASDVIDSKGYFEPTAVTTSKTAAPVGSLTAHTPGISYGTFVCPSSFGYFEDPASCNSFYQCSYGYPYKFACTLGLVWNPSTNSCDWPFNYYCEKL